MTTDLDRVRVDLIQTLNRTDAPPIMWRFERNHGCTLKFSMITPNDDGDVDQAAA